MAKIDSDSPPVVNGGWQDAEALRRWSFARRSPQQRLDWLVAALAVRYGAAQERDAAHPKGRAKLGSVLAKLSEASGGLELDIARDPSLHEPPEFE